MALSYAVRDRLMTRYLASQEAIRAKPQKTVAYLSAEFLIGPQLNNNLLNLGITKEAEEAVKRFGIESLSRGAVKATFVEKNRNVVNILTENLNNISDKENYLVLNVSVEKFLKNCSKKYDIIFADPPYSTFSFEILRSNVSNLLNYGGTFCMERRFEEGVIEDVKIKNYGKTQFLIWEKI